MISEKLELLKKLDPDTWKTISMGIPMQPCGQYMVFDMGEIRSCQYHEAYIPLSGLLPEVADGWIQACLQRAIVTKIDHNAEKTRDTWSYEIIADRDGFKARVDAKSSFFTDGDSPAEALLAAYIEAIQ